MQFSLRTTFNYEVESQDAGLYQNQGSRLVVLMENDELHELDIEKQASGESPKEVEVEVIPDELLERNLKIEGLQSHSVRRSYHKTIDTDLNINLET